jgi:hypothetical protein
VKLQTITLRNIKKMCNFVADKNNSLLKTSAKNVYENSIINLGVGWNTNGTSSIETGNSFTRRLAVLA